MLSSIYPLVAIYFVIGAIAIVFINRRKTQTRMDKTNRWIKYFLYLLIVNAIILSINFEMFFYVAMGIGLVAIYEFIRMSMKTTVLRQLLFGIPFMLVLSVFLLASNRVSVSGIGFVYTLVFCFDGFAQIIGQLFGKRQITPKWSPNKTLGGFIGAFVITVATAFYYCLNVADSKYPDYPVILIFGVCVSLFSFSGDILASLFKRICGEKDYSNLIPQHGGILDRFDSFIFALSGYYCLTQLLQINGL